MQEKKMLRKRFEKYKEYPFPWRVLLWYVVFSAIGAGLLELVAFLWALKFPVTGFRDGSAAVVIMLLLFAVLLVLAFILSRFACGDKEYRGIGLYRIFNLILLLTPFVFGFLLYWGQIVNEDFVFFNGLTCFLDCFFPWLVVVIFKMRVNRCRQCGLINTLDSGTWTGSVSTGYDVYDNGRGGFRVTPRKIYSGGSTLYACKICKGETRKSI